MRFYNCCHTRISKMVRVRFAPSPTGNLHLGSLRTALFNYLFAKKYNGSFVLRIEDTDQERLIPHSTDQIEQVLNAFGLNTDESPLKGGLYGPYKQSERLKIYQTSVEKIIDSKHAYHCFCSIERLEILRKNAAREKRFFKYDNQCRNLKEEEIRARLREQQPRVIRFKFDPAKIAFNDCVYGKIVHEPIEGDFVILKRDGFPTYHFANVVDDHHMAITNVIRGNDWLTSTAKHVKLYEALEWEPPKFTHLSLMTRDGSKKLSKRDADALVNHYTEDQGYLPTAVLNLLVSNGSGITGYDPNALYSLEEMVDRFDETLIHRNNFMLDGVKLENYGKLAFQKADFDTLVSVVRARLIDLCKSEIMAGTLDRALADSPSYIRRVLEFLKRGEESFSKIADLTQGDFKYFFCRPNSTEAIQKIFPDKAQTIKFLTKFNQKFHKPSENKWTIKELKQMALEESFPYPELMKLFRLALIGNVSGPPISELMEFFSVNEANERIEAVIRLLTG